MKLFLLASALILTLVFKARTTNVPITHNDTIPKPRYEYGARYSIWMPLNKPYPPLDTINMVIEELLLDRTGREAAQFRAILSKQFASLLGRPTVDSAKIGGKP